MEQAISPLPPIEPTAGSDPRAWAQSVQQARAAGRLDDRAYAGYSPGLEKAFSSPNPSPLQPEQRNARMEELRQGRIAGTVTDKQWEEFTSLAAGEQFTPPPSSLDDQFAAMQADIMKPAAPHEYQFTFPANVRRDEDMEAFDGELRTALAAGGVPRQLGGPLVETADRLSHELATASPEARQSRIDETTAKLEQRWGADFKARRDAAAEVADAIISHSPMLGEIIDEAPYLLADVAIWDYLDRVARHRASKRA